MYVKIFSFIINIITNNIFFTNIINLIIELVKNLDTKINNYFDRPINLINKIESLGILLFSFFINWYDISLIDLANKTLNKLEFDQQTHKSIKYNYLRAVVAVINIIILSSITKKKLKNKDIIKITLIPVILLSLLHIIIYKFFEKDSIMFF